MQLRESKMKIYVFLLFIAAYSTISPNPLSGIFKEANELFQNKKYESSARLYESILKEGYESADLYYNLGNAYFRQNKLGLAILNYERALKLEPGHEDALYNLEIANFKTIDKIDELPKIFILQWWDNFVGMFSVTGWSGIVLIFLVITLAGLGFFLSSKKYEFKRVAFIFSSASALFLAISIFIMLYSYNKASSISFGILTEKAYTVKTSPDDTSKDAFVVHEGIKFVIEDSFKEWYKIKLFDNKVGWIKKESFSKI